IAGHPPPPARPSGSPSPPWSVLRFPPSALLAVCPPLPISHVPGAEHADRARPCSLEHEEEEAIAVRPAQHQVDPALSTDAPRVVEALLGLLGGDVVPQQELLFIGFIPVEFGSHPPSGP